MNNIKEKEEEIIFKKRNINAIIPKKGSKFSAGYDLFSIEDKKIEPLDKEMISTGISVKLPHNSYGRVAPRSGLTWKKFIDVGAGVIDEDYTGESKILIIYLYIILLIIVKVILFNFSKKNVNITKGERIAQLIVEKIVPTFVKEIGIEEELPITDRGEDGFGSTENKEENNNNINKKRKNS